LRADRKSAAQKVDQVPKVQSTSYEALLGERVHGEAYKGTVAHPPVVNQNGAQSAISDPWKLKKLKW